MKLMERRRIQTVLTGRRVKPYDQLTPTGKWYRNHPEVRRLQMAKANARNRTQSGKVVLRAHLLQHKYGLTVHQFDVLYRTCGGLCPGCGNHMMLHRVPGDSHWCCVDHDHVTGEVRGLLCHRCNTAIGMMNDDAQTAANLAAYLSSSLDRN